MGFERVLKQAECIGGTGWGEIDAGYLCTEPVIPQFFQSKAGLVHVFVPGSRWDVTPFKTGSHTSPQNRVAPVLV